MNFTTAKDKKVNAKIQADLDYIANRVARLLGDNLHAILLCGGFGRGEGSVVVKKNEIHIVNDYDFTIVLNSKNRFHYLTLYRKIHAPLENLAVELAEALAIKQVDLSPKPLNYFSPKNALKIENYEVKKGHVLIYGKDDPTLGMPDFKAVDIPLFEGTWLFRNRGAGLLLSALYFVDSGKVPTEKMENFVVECTKAKLAMGDALLLLNARYHHLYSKRFSHFLEIDISGVPEGERIKEMYKRAIDQKLSPDFDHYFRRDPIKWWFEVTKIYDLFFKYFEGKRLGIPFEDWLFYKRIPKPEDKIEFKTLIKKMLNAGRTGFNLQRFFDACKTARKTFSIALVPLVLFSLKEKGFDIAMMEEAAAMLNLPLTGDHKRDWTHLAKAVLNEIHPGGEAGRVLKAD